MQLQKTKFKKQTVSTVCFFSWTLQVAGGKWQVSGAAHGDYNCVIRNCRGKPIILICWWDRKCRGGS